MIRLLPAAVTQGLQDRLEGLDADVVRLTRQAFEAGEVQLATQLYELEAILEQGKNLLTGDLRPA